MAFDPARRRIRRGWPLAVGGDHAHYLDPGTWPEHASPVSYGTVMTPTVIADPRPAPGSADDAFDPESETGKVDIVGPVIQVLDAESAMIPQMAAMRHGDDPVVVEAGEVFRHRLDFLSTDLDFPTFWHEERDIDDGERLIFSDVRPQSLSYAFTENDFVRLTVTQQAERAHAYTLPAETVGGTTALGWQLYVMGIPRYDLRDTLATAGTLDLHVRVDTVGANALTVSVKIGDGSAYGAVQSTIPITALSNGRPDDTGELVDSNGTGPLGNGDTPLVAYAIETTPGSIEALDEAEAVYPRAAWVHAPSASPALKASGATILLPNRSGTLVSTACVPSGTITITPPFRLVPCATGAWRRVARAGRLTVQLAITEEWESIINDHYKTTRPSGQRFGCEIVFRSVGEIFTGYRSEVRINMRNLRVNGSTKAVTSDDDRQQQWTATAHQATSDASGYISPVVIEVTNTMSALPTAPAP